MKTNMEDSNPKSMRNNMGAYDNATREGTIKFSHEFFLETMTFMKPKYGERHIVDV